MQACRALDLGYSPQAPPPATARDTPKIKPKNTNHPLLNSPSRTTPPGPHPRTAIPQGAKNPPPPPLQSTSHNPIHNQQPLHPAPTYKAQKPDKHPINHSWPHSIAQSKAIAEFTWYPMISPYDQLCPWLLNHILKLERLKLRGHWRHYQIFHWQPPSAMRPTDAYAVALPHGRFITPPKLLKWYQITQNIKYIQWKQRKKDIAC